MRSYIIQNVSVLTARECAPPCYLLCATCQSNTHTAASSLLTVVTTGVQNFHKCTWYYTFLFVTNNLFYKRFKLFLKEAFYCCEFANKRHKTTNNIYKTWNMRWVLKEIEFVSNRNNLARSHKQLLSVAAAVHVLQLFFIDMLPWPPAVSACVTCSNNADFASRTALLS